MAKRRQGVQDKLRQCVRELDGITTDDTQDLAKVCGRLERVSDALYHEQPVFGELAYVLYKSLERLVVDRPDTDTPLTRIKEGVYVLTQMQCALGDTVFDRSLFQYLARFSGGMKAVPAGGVDLVSDKETDQLAPREQDVKPETEMNPSDAAAEQQDDLELDDGFWDLSEEESRDPQSPQEEAEDGEAVVATSIQGVEDEEDDPQDIMDELARRVMSVGLDDLSGLGEILTHLEKLGAAYSSDRPTSKALATKITEVINAIILDTCDGDEALAIVEQGISFMQRQQIEFDRTGQELEITSDLSRAISRLFGEDGAGDEDATNENGENETVDSALSVSDRMSAEPEISEMDMEILLDFLSESEDHLNNAEGLLLALESNPEDSETLNAIFRAFHTIKGSAGFVNLNDIVNVAHVMEDFLDEARNGTRRIEGALLDLVFESVDILKMLLIAVQAKIDGDAVPEIDVAGFLSRAETVTKQTGEQAATKSEAKPDVNFLPALNQAPQKPVKRDQLFVRVGTEKLDQLVNQVGELVIAQTQVSQNPEIVGTRSQKLAKDISQLVKISTDIQEIAMSMRMVPIKSTFDRMARLVRDLSRKFEKDIVFQTSGEDTELDKNVVEEIVDPLTHMVRNALDHGIESPEERLAAGKFPKGVVSLEAYHKGGNIVIELKEDGRGLNRDKILKKAIERGVVNADADLTDDEVANLIFMPGLSTAEQVSDVSGRGVGMDVVRKSIENLRGKVEVHTEAGKGTSFVIRLPLTLAIIDGMVIGVGDERYILPMTSIVRSMRPKTEEIHSVMNVGEMVMIQDELFPLMRLHERFQVALQYSDPSDGLVVVVESEDGTCCVLVDELIGMQQVVIKGLDESLRTDKCLSGCAILGDGQVGLILDANELVQMTNHKKINGAYKSAS